MTRLVFVALTVSFLVSCASGQTQGSSPGPMDDDPMNDPGGSGDPPNDDPPNDGDPIENLVSMIRTEVDPTYVYEYEQTKFVPPSGQTLLVLGQTLDDIDGLTAAFPEETTPGGWAAYWGIPSTEGLTNTITNDNGDSHNHQALVDRFPNSAIQSALWMVGTWGVAKDTADGVYDDVIRAFSAWAKSVDAPIYLRIGYEFDGPHNELEPTEYITAYTRFVDITREEGVTNVAFVWHSYASRPYKGYALSSWYPGDDYVDWVAVSLFGHLYGLDPGPDANAVFEFARTHKKPVMIAEASPIRGISENNLDSWNTWFVNFFSLAYERNIKAVSFINTDWSDTEADAALGWRDARLQNNDTVSGAFFMETAKDRYLRQSPELFEQLGYAP